MSEPGADTWVSPAALTARLAEDILPLCVILLFEVVRSFYPAGPSREATAGPGTCPQTLESVPILKGTKLWSIFNIVPFWGWGEVFQEKFG